MSEIVDLTTSMMTQFLTTFTIFISIIPTYVVAAFAAGKNLNKIQLVIVNTTFVLAASIIGYIAIAVFRRFYLLAASAPKPEGALPAVDFSWALAVLLIAMVLGSPVFMMQVRRAD